MTHARTKPAAQSRQYGRLVGTIKAGREDGGSSPHYEIHIVAGADYRAAVNVKSVDGSNVIALFTTDYQPPAFLDLAALASGTKGFTALKTGKDGEGLDYVHQTGLVDLSAMQPIPPTGQISLGTDFDAAVQKAVADDQATVVVFGQYYEDKGRDSTFGFSPEQGVHDIHMMQGNPSGGSFSDDNVAGGDGALFIRYGDGSVTAFFARFSTQTTDTDPQTGAPLER